MTVEAPEPVAPAPWRDIRVEPERPDDRTCDWPSRDVTDMTIWAQGGRPPCAGTGDGLDREHIFAWKEAWDSRPDGFSRTGLHRVAEDRDNLTLALAVVVEPVTAEQTVMSDHRLPLLSRRYSTAARISCPPMWSQSSFAGSPATPVSRPTATTLTTRRCEP